MEMILYNNLFVFHYRLIIHLKLLNDRISVGDIKVKDQTKSKKVSFRFIFKKSQIHQFIYFEFLNYNNECVYLRAMQQETSQRRFWIMTTFRLYYFILLSIL